MDDNTLLNHAQKDGTILLTRDQELYDRARKRSLSSVLILGKTEGDSLAQLAKSLGISLEIDMAMTRCPKCGSPLREVSKDEASNSVPPASWKLYDRFWKCNSTNCGKVYWVGSHWKNIRQTLEKTRKKVEAPET
jgi:uncharacterized protein